MTPTPPTHLPSPRQRLAAAVASVAALVLIGHAQAQAGGGVAGGAPAAQASGRFEFRDHAAPVPSSWQPLPPASSFRAAQYRVPAAAGAGPGEVVVYYFGRGQGGSVEANTQRWASQFTRADGGSVEPKVEAFVVSGLPATIVELNGSYARGIGMTQGVAGTPDQTLLAAIIESPHGNLTFQLHGDTATVNLHRAGFVAMIRGFKPR